MIKQPYDTIAAEWDQARQTLRPREIGYIDRLLETLSPGATVLDLGCGTGRPIAGMILGRGYRVVGVDQATELLALARRRYPEGEWIEARLETYPFDRGCDAAVMWDSLFHIERRWHEPIIRGIARALPPGGRLIVTSGGSSHPPFTDTMFGHTFFYDAHPPEETCTIVEGAGFRILASELIDPPVDERNKGRLILLAERE